MEIIFPFSTPNAYICQSTYRTTITITTAAVVFALNSLHHDNDIRWKFTSAMYNFLPPS